MQQLLYTQWNNLTCMQNSTTIDFHHFCVSSPIAPVLSKTRGPFVKGRPLVPCLLELLSCVSPA